MKIKEQHEYLAGEAARLIRQCRTDAGEGTPIYRTEAGGNYYGQMYVRDFAYMVEGFPTAFRPEDVKKAYLCFIRQQRSDGVMPEAVRPDGTAWYLSHGNAPCTDNAQFMVKLAHEYYTATKDISLFAETSSALVKGLHSLPRHPTSGLMWIDPDKPHAAYGFTDSIAKTGEVFFSSMLYWEALNKLSSLFRIAGETRQAQQCEKEASGIRNALQIFWAAEDGLFRAASQDCNQPDIWGSAYAAYIGLATPEQARRTSEFFVSNYRKVTKRGQVRHIIEGTSWERVNETKTSETTRPGNFQNGAYWGMPVGWVSYVLGLTNPGLAVQIYEEMIADYRTNGIYECINDGYCRCPDYVASVAVPLKDFPR